MTPVRDLFFHWFKISPDEEEQLGQADIKANLTESHSQPGWAVAGWTVEQVRMERVGSGMHHYHRPITSYTCLNR